LYTLDRSLRLLHPFCPFVSEALWSELNAHTGAAARNLGRGEYANGGNRQQNGTRGSGLLMLAAWPKAETEFIDAEREAQFASLFEAVVAVRAVRQELIDNSPKERKKDVSSALAAPLKVTIRTADAALADRLNAQSHVLMQMANVQPPEIGPGATIPSPASATAIGGGTIYVALTPDLLQVEKLRLKKEIEKYEQYVPKVESKLKNENFVKNAPAELVAEERQRLKNAQEKCASLKAALAELG
jgi:valyl-tRNA synthetase